MSTPQKILIIDDEARLRHAIAAYLEDSGYVVLQASNGAEGINVFLDGKPDLVVTDLRMPEMNGFEFVRWLRRESHPTPVIVLTGTGDQEAEVLALSLGARAYLTKPIEDLGLLESSIVRALTPDGTP